MMAWRSDAFDAGTGQARGARAIHFMELSH